MKLIKRGNKLLFQNNSGKPTQTLDLSVNIIHFQNNKISFSGADLEIYFSIFESIEDENGTIKLKADFADFAELEKYLQENIFFLTINEEQPIIPIASGIQDGLISKELYIKIINANSLFVMSDSDVDSLLPPGNLSIINDPYTGLPVPNAINLDPNFVNATSYLRVETKDIDNNTINGTLFLPDYLNFLGDIRDWANKTLIKVTNHASSSYNLNVVTSGNFEGARVKIKKIDGTLSDFINNILPNETITLRWSYSRTRFEEQ